MIFGVGYIGEGEYDNKCKSYAIWTNMIRRCYGELRDERTMRIYFECTVSEEWLNFQNFAKWYEENYYEIEGMSIHIDKDIIIKGNKIYSAETCVFVPSRINNLFTKANAKRGELPIGVRGTKYKNKYRAWANNNGPNHLGTFNTITEAFEAYKLVKEKYIKEVAEEYIKLIPYKLYKAMYNYKVEITD